MAISVQSTYPKELSNRLHTLVEKAGMVVAFETVLKEFPKFKDRLTKERAYAVLQAVRRAKARDIMQTQEKGKKLFWKELSDDQRNAVMKGALKLRAKQPPLRWSAISARLAEKYPYIHMPKAINLARMATPFNTDKSNDKVTKSINPAREKCYTLQISNSGSFEVKAEINHAMVSRILKEVVG